jgi:hypothetical protein
VNGQLNRSQLESKRTITGSYHNVKLVPRLGPFAVSNRSKNVTASGVEKNVTDKRPP